MNNRGDNNYSRIEINLLPPELAPGPAVRALVIINFALVAVTLATILVTAALPMFKITDLRNQIESMQSQINALAPEEANHQTLMDIKDAVDGYGRIVSLASVDYVEVPLVLDRLARVIPDGVYIKQVQNRTTRSRTGINPDAKPDVIVQVTLAASRRDPRLILETLQAFKQDPLFADCFLGSAQAVEQPLGELLERYGVDWTVTEPEGDIQPSSREFEFEIQARLHHPLPPNLAPVSADFSTYLASVEFKVPPPEPDKGKGKSSQDEPAGADTGEPAAGGAQ